MTLRKKPSFVGLTGCFLLFTFIANCPAPAEGQAVVQGVRMSPATPVQQAAPTTPVAPSQATPGTPDAATAEAKEESPEDKLVTALLAAKFDRTTQAVLKAWSQQKKKEKKAKEEEKKQATATVANYFDGLAVLAFEEKPKFKAKDPIVITLGEQTVEATILNIDDKKVVAQFAKPKPEKKAPAKDTTSEKSQDEAKPAEGDSKTEPKETGEAQPSTDSQATDAGTSESENKSSDDENSEPTETEKTKAAPETDGEAKEKSNAPEATIDADPKWLELNSGDQVSVTKKVTEDKSKQADEENKKKVEAFVRNVTMGEWDQVKTFLKTLKSENADKVYAHVLKSLAVAKFELPEGVPKELAQQVLAQMRQGNQKPINFLTPEDILQLTEAAPNPIQLVVKKPKSEEGGEAASNDGPKLPPGVELPPGVTIDQIPPEALAQMQAAAAQNGTPTAPGAENKAEISHIRALATLIDRANDEGHDFNMFIAQLKSGTTHFGIDERMKQLTTADMLMKGGLIEHVEAFLPSLEDEATQKDIEALKIWSSLALRQHSTKKVADWLEKAWQINQWIVGLEDVEKADRDRALTKLIELSPKVDKELGQTWLNSSFTEEPERGKQILSNLGSQSATMAKQAANVSTSQRLKLLRLQNKAVENLLEVSPEKASDWAQAMTLLAQNWLTEAETGLKYSKQNSRREYMQIDMYGNYYWVDENQWAQRYGGRRNPQPIKLGDLLETMPSEAWRKHVSPSLHTQLRKVTANLHLRINEEDEAFPYIEKIAEDHPEIARDLIHEFLRIWTRNHDPNTDKRQRNPYIYFYGFDQKAEAIPLTRSKQERNLAELSKWVDRIRKLNLEDIDEDLLANAFTTCHSSAEVFRIKAVKSVFGELGELKPETIAAIAQKMRVNLSGQWRDIRNQEQKQTNRREPEVQKEVLRGYDVGMKMVDEALASDQDSWHLHLAKACLMFDQNAYSQTVQKSSEFSDKRDLAFEQFELAASKYGDIATTLEEKDQSTDVYDYWFYAALGACDLGKITDKTVPDLRQYPKIREAILGLPGVLAEKHMAKVANNMFTRMSPIKPEIKFRYLRGGFVVVGDHPRAWEATNLYDYYKDLVSEIKLDVQVDGSEDVGHSQPFGVYVNLLHTSEIERESGGFQKYVQNQNNMPYAFNYGRPTEDYRDKFTDAVGQALEKHYEVLNVTFVGADAMQSIPAPEEGWRLTPYAYLLLKPRGSEIDRIAPLKLDLDFLDTSGYVVIPIESPAIVIDASNENGEDRPIADLQVTQTLDERQADEGKLVLEVSASAKGLVPELEDILDINQADFEVVSIDDQGVLPTSFDKESNQVQILSDRSWTVEYKAKEGSKNLTNFSFSNLALEDAGTKFQRYEDADLVEVTQTVALEKNYDSFSWNFLYWLIPLIVLGLVGVAALIFATNQPKQVEEARFNIPEDINPFTVLTLLKDIKRRNGISSEQAIKLEDSINRVEQYYFGKDDAEMSDDLEKLAKDWVGQAR